MKTIETIETLLTNAVALVASIRNISAEVLTKHIQRGDIVKATWLSLISGRPAFFLGEPGIDKTGTVQAMADRISGCAFYDALMPMVVSAEQLLVESTSIEEVPTANGGKELRTKDTLGRAACAHVLFADEIWKGEARVLQTLLDLAKGDGVRHEGALVKTPLMAFLAASNELPDSEGNLGAAWSRMTIRVKVNPLDRAGKVALVKARLNRARGTAQPSAQLTLADIEVLREARAYVEIPESLVETVLDIYQELMDESGQDFAWTWADDRRFGRVFDVLQAHALLDGRVKCATQDLGILEMVLWDTPEQIAIIRAKVAPYVRTPFLDAQELVDALLSPVGVVALVLAGNRVKGVEALTQCESAGEELKRLMGEATDDCMRAGIKDLQDQLQEIKNGVIAVVTGMKIPQAQGGGQR